MGRWPGDTPGAAHTGPLAPLPPCSGPTSSPASRHRRARSHLQAPRRRRWARGVTAREGPHWEQEQVCDKEKRQEHPEGSVLSQVAALQHLPPAGGDGPLILHPQPRAARGTQAHSVQGVQLRWDHPQAGDGAPAGSAAIRTLCSGRGRVGTGVPRTTTWRPWRVQA